MQLNVQLPAIFVDIQISIQILVSAEMLQTGHILLICSDDDVEVYARKWKAFEIKVGKNRFSDEKPRQHHRDVPARKRQLSTDVIRMLSQWHDWWEV